MYMDLTHMLVLSSVWVGDGCYECTLYAMLRMHAVCNVSP